MGAKWFRTMFIRHCFNKAYATMPTLSADVQSVIDDFAERVRYLDADPDIPPIWDPEPSEDKVSKLVEKFVKLVKEYLNNVDVAEVHNDVANTIISLSLSTLRNCLNHELPETIMNSVKTAINELENLKISK